MRQQFSTEINIRIAQYGAEFVRNFRELIGDDTAPDIAGHHFGYLYLADTAARADQLRANQRVQAQLGVGTQILDRDALAA